jgi:hypothetical protein
VLECCSREAAGWLGGYWDKVLRRVAEEDEGEGGEEEEEE